MPHRSVVTSSLLLANREVPANVSLKQTQQEIPYNWKDDDFLWGYMNQFKISSSGAGFISPPYTAFWDRIWGATPVEDLPKYKDLYNFTPYIKASIDVTVNLTLSNSFELEGSTPEIRQWLTDLAGRNIIARSEARAQLGFTEALPADLKDKPATALPTKSATR